MRLNLVLAVLGFPALAHAQDTLATARLVVTHDSVPLAGAIVRSGNTSARTDHGRAVLRLAPGDRRIIVARLGLKAETLSVVLRAGMDTTFHVTLFEAPTEVERVIVSAMRTERRIEDVPLRVEVLQREEIEEKMLMTPGDISMLLNETGGLRVASSSPALGGARVRVQGLRGRYTLLLTDGLPLAGAHPGGFGLMQIPPMDLAQVEVIKGVASALYGASALGGVVNLVSRRPAEDEVELLLNQTTRGGVDAVVWRSLQANDRVGYTLLAGTHRQRAVDVDRDAWVDIPAYSRITARPRLFWSGDQGRNAIVTGGIMSEHRSGGTVAGGLTPAGSSYGEALRTLNLDAGTVARFPFGSSVFSVRGSASRQSHRHEYGTRFDRDRHDTFFAELALADAGQNSSAVIGLAFQQERFRSEIVPRFDHSYYIPAAFGQLDGQLFEQLAFSLSARLDAHSAYGSRVNPRASLLLRLPAAWSLRLSGGTGTFVPTPFIEEVEAVGLAPIVGLGEARPEQATGVSLDAGGALGPLELNMAIFGSRIARALASQPQTRIIVPPQSQQILIVNSAKPTRTVGADVMARFRHAELTTTLSYTAIAATEDPFGARRLDVPLTPRSTAGLVSVWEQERKGRVGIEAYYTGKQFLGDNPYRAQSEPYVIVGAIAERRFGEARVFINLENLGDARMTKHQRLVRPTQAPGGRWTTDAWAPLDGRVINGGVRYAF